jgi:hypothetical protein
MGEKHGKINKKSIGISIKILFHSDNYSKVSSNWLKICVKYVSFMLSIKVKNERDEKRKKDHQTRNQYLLLRYCPICVLQMQ